MDDKTLKVFAYIKISSYREKALKSLENGNKTPTQIANDADIRLSHISKVLREFKECGVAVCINEEERKNRIYKLTPLGRDVLEIFDD
nr:winged helix-turn-helix domain-containing protein [uncultured Methanobrevibacter sp.]